MAVVIRNLGSCMMQSRWDFADDSISGKWSAYHEVYRNLHVTRTDETVEGPLKSGYALVVTKNKIRGRGRALKLRFKASEGKDLVLLGWATTLQGNTAE